MKKMFLCLVALMSFSAAQASVPSKKVAYSQEFTLRSNFSALETVYYNCDSAEDQVEDMLVKMGASNVHVTCTGGLDTFNPGMSFPAHISVSFETMRAAANSSDATSSDWKTVSIRSFDNCFMMSQVYENVKDSFEMKDVKAPRSCARADSSFRLEFTTLF